jgi:hypothetical protein
MMKTKLIKPFGKKLSSQVGLLILAIFTLAACQPMATQTQAPLSTQPTATAAPTAQIN